MLGPDQPVILHLLDIPPAQQSLEGVKMELLDAAFPLVKGEPLNDCNRLFSCETYHKCTDDGCSTLDL